MEKTNVINGIRKIFRGFTVAVITAAAGVFISGLLVMLTSLSVGSSSAVIMTAVTIGAFINGFCAASAVGRKGLLTGIAAGVIYIICIIVCMAAVSGCTGISPGLALFAFPLAASAAAGVLGVGK